MQYQTETIPFDRMMLSLSIPKRLFLFAAAVCLPWRLALKTEPLQGAFGGLDREPPWQARSDIKEWRHAVNLLHTLA